jgi:hypothetical protein
MGAALQSRAAAAPADALYTRPGRIVPAGDGARLNLYCTGNGSPTVVFAFAERYLPEVAGLVMVEADAQDLEPEQMRQEDRRGEARVIQRLRECRDAIALTDSKP